MTEEFKKWFDEAGWKTGKAAKDLLPIWNSIVDWWNIEFHTVAEENEQLRKDAERYRWLRGNVEAFGEDIICVDDESLPGYVRYITAAECDAAIDAAIKEMK